MIEKVRRGLGKPDMIYVKNVVSVENVENNGSSDPSPKKSNSFTSRGKISVPTKVKKIAPNNTENNDTDIINLPLKVSTSTTATHPSKDEEDDIESKNLCSEASSCIKNACSKISDYDYSSIGSDLAKTICKPLVPGKTFRLGNNIIKAEALSDLIVKHKDTIDDVLSSTVSKFKKAHTK